MQQPPELTLFNHKMETACSSETSEQAHTKNVVIQKTNFLLPVLLYLYISSVYTFAHAHPHIDTHRIGVRVCVRACAVGVHRCLVWKLCIRSCK
jgi:hypothetical protein